MNNKFYYKVEIRSDGKIIFDAILESFKDMGFDVESEFTMNVEIRKTEDIKINYIVFIAIQDAEFNTKMKVQNKQGEEI